jgi:hypothetical protein
MPLPPAAPTVPLFRPGVPQPNCTVEKAEVLPHHIAYLKVRSAPEPAVCLYAAAAAMASLHAVDALILDLREPGPGDPGMVRFLGQLEGKPAYILTSRHAPSTSGAVPDHKTKTDDALTAAQRLAVERLRSQESAPQPQYEPDHPKGQ